MYTESILFDLKLTPPELPEDFVIRDRLFTRFEEATAHDLAVVTAPAGFGKSLAAAAWLRRTSSRAVWFSLSPEESGFSAFLTLLRYGLRSRVPELSSCPELSGHESAGGDEISPKYAAALLARVLKQHIHTGKICLLFDDFHTCGTGAVTAFLLHLCEYASGALTVMLSSRQVPVLPLAKLRAYGRLCEIGSNDLRFTKEETVSFLRAKTGVELTADQAALVDSRAEGWAAGLQLLCLSLGDRTDLQGFLREFSAGHRFVLDYLMEEVISRLDGETVRFLLSTSLVEPFTPELCAELSGNHDAAGLLERIEADNLFLVRLDDRGEWFRYHHLFRELLFLRAKKTMAGDLPALHRRAADWYRGAGLQEPGFEHLLSGGFADEAFEYLESISNDMYIRGRLSSLIRMYESLPFDGFRDHPNTCIWYAWFLASVGRLPRIPTLLAWAEEGRAAVKDPRLFNHMGGGIASVRAMTASRMGNIDLAIEETGRAKELFAEGEYHDRAVASFLRGNALAHKGDVDGAEREFELCYELAVKAGVAYTRGMSLCERASLLLRRNRPEDALVLLREAEALARDDDGPALWCGMVYIYMAEAYHALRRPDSARSCVERGIELTGYRGNPGPLVRAHILLMGLRLDAGEIDAARESLAALEELSEEFRLHPAGYDAIREARKRFESVSSGSSSRGAESPAETLSARGGASAPGGTGISPASGIQPDAGPSEPLTRRELEILELLARGRTNREMADALFVSVGTVKTHLHHISAKLGTVNRTETVALARELGILPDRAGIGPDAVHPRGEQEIHP